MANIFDTYDELYRQITNLSSLEDLSFRFYRDNFPMKMEFVPRDENQLNLLGDKEEKNSKLTFIMGDNMVVDIENGFSIDDNTFNKLKNACKRLYHKYLEICFFNNFSKGVGEREDE